MKFPQRSEKTSKNKLENSTDLTTTPLPTHSRFQNKYVQFKAELKKHQEVAEAAHKAAVAKFSPAAREADAKLAAIANDPSLTNSQKNLKIELFVSQLPATVRQEIEVAMRSG